MFQENKPHEARAFLPQNNKCEAHVMIPRDAGDAPPPASKHFDPFTERNITNPTTDCQTLTHLLKSTIGSGIMTMPYAFRDAGLLGGGLGVLLIMGLCTHTSYVLVDCAHKLYYRTRRTEMDYEDIVEAAFATGPKWGRKYATFARYFLQVWLFAVYFGACSVDNLIIATNYGQVIEYYTTFSGNETAAAVASLAAAEVDVSLMRIIMGALLPLLVLFVWVPDLKYLTPLSTVANLLMAVGLALTLYYLVQAPRPIDQLSLMRPVTEFPKFFSVTLFAMENIGVMMPLENNMASPEHFLGTCGILNRGMFGIMFVYLLVGALGYARYGSTVHSVVTTNLPLAEPMAQAVKILIGSTVLLTFGLQFYVCREMVWSLLKQYFPRRPLLAEYTIRALLVVACVGVAIAVPQIGPMVSLIGALGFSLIGIIFPACLELLVYWDLLGYGRFHWKIYKNIVLIVIGIMAIVFGSNSAIKEIVDKYHL